MPVNLKLTNMMYINVAPKAIVDKNTKIAVKNFSVNQFSISELDKYKIGYSYDLTVSKLGLSSGGAHEISLQIQLGCFYKNPSQNNIPCPNF